MLPPAPRSTRFWVISIFALGLCLLLAGPGPLLAQAPPSPAPAPSQPPLAPAPAAASGPSLIPNGDFERARGQAADWPDGWGVKTPGNGITWEVDNGKHFLRLVSQQPGQLQTLLRAVPLKHPGEVHALRVTVRYRASGVKPGAKPEDDARAVVTFQGPGGVALETGAAPLLLAPAADWTEVSGQFLVPPTATRLTFLAGLLHAAAGTVDIENVAAVPLDEAAAAALAAAAPEPAAPAASLVANGDFSQLDADGQWPVKWGHPNPGMSFVTEGDTRFIRLTVQDPGKEQMLNKTVPLKAGVKGVEVSIRWRADGVQPGAHEWFDARTIVQFLGSDGGQVSGGGGAMVFTHKPGHTEWKQAVKSFPVPEGARALRLMSGLFMARAGTVDLAEFRVTPMDDATAELASLTHAAQRIEKEDQNAAGERKVDQTLDAQLAATGNLVPNGGFEEVNQDGRPVAWNPHGDGISWEEDHGDHYMRLTAQEPDKVKMLYRMIPLKSGVKGIEVKVRYRTADLKKGSKPPGDARMVMHYLGGARFGHLEYGKTVTPAPGGIRFSSAAKDWTEESRRYLVPAGATKLQIMPGLWNVGAGTVDLAEIRVAPLSDADALAMTTAHVDAAEQQADQDAVIEGDLAAPPQSRELKVSGNQLLDPDGNPVWLQGLCVDSMEWSMGERILWSTHVALDEWKANAIRLPVNVDWWFGRGKNQKPGSEDAYREAVDKVIKLIAAKGAYVALDLHAFGAPTDKHLAFWKDAAVRYKDNPAVMYELFNEPHGISWEIWRDGGELQSPRNKSTDVNVNENTVKVDGGTSVGMQGLVDAVRATGAKNVIIAGGLDWGYDLSRVAEDCALDDKGGHGIMYSTHIYPWKKDWQTKVLPAAAKYPIFVGEDGTPADYSGYQFVPEPQRYPIEGWANDLLGFMQKNHLNWTGFSFHPHCGPQVISDWDYTPTPYWGVYVKEALAGKQFEMQKMR